MIAWFTDHLRVMFSRAATKMWTAFAGPIATGALLAAFNVDITVLCSLFAEPAAAGLPPVADIATRVVGGALGASPLGIVGGLLTYALRNK